MQDAPAIVAKGWGRGPDVIVSQAPQHPQQVAVAGQFSLATEAVLEVLGHGRARPAAAVYQEGQLQ
jgi:type III secretion system FlhB-like substrate exporter